MMLDREIKRAELAIPDADLPREAADEPDGEPTCETCGGEIGIGGIEDLCADCVEDEY